MYCTICGKQLPDDALLCPQCGVPVKSAKKTEPQVKLGETKKRNPFSLVGFLIVLVANVFLCLCTNIAVFTSAEISSAVVWVAIGVMLVGLGLSIAGLVTKRTHGTGGKWLAIVGIILAAALIPLSFISLAVGSVFKGIFELYDLIFI